MKTHSQNNHRTASSLSLLVLLALAAFAPMAGGVLQQYHRSITQGKLRHGKTALLPVRVVVAKADVAKCFSQNENELVIGGMHYDVVNMEQKGNCIIFSAVPDVKETRICALTLKSILFPSKNLTQKTSIALLDYFPCPEVYLLLNQDPNIVRSVFNVRNVAPLAGFEWMFGPPPDVAVV